MIAARHGHAVRAQQSSWHHRLPATMDAAAAGAGAGGCCWGTKCCMKDQGGATLFKCSACKSDYHHLCAVTGTGGGGNREELGKVTECCNCADGKVLAPLPPRKRGGAAAARGAQEDRATESQQATNPKPTKAARGAARGATQAAGQGDLLSFFRSPPAAAKKKPSSLPKFASKAAAAAAGDDNNKGNKRRSMSAPGVDQQSMQLDKTAMTERLEAYMPTLLALEVIGEQFLHCLFLHCLSPLSLPITALCFVNRSERIER